MRWMLGKVCPHNLSGSGSVINMAEHALAGEVLGSLDRIPNEEPVASDAGLHLRLPLRAHEGSAGSAGSHAWDTDERPPSSGES